MKLTSAVTVVFTGTMLVFFIAFVIGFFRHRKRVRPYGRYALIPATAVVLLDFAALVLAPEVLEQMGLPVVLCVDLVAFARVAIFGAVGMYCAASIGRPHTPLLRAALRRPARRPPEHLRGLLLWGTACAVVGVVYSSVLFMLVPVQMTEAMRQMLQSPPADLASTARPSLVGAFVMLQFAVAEEVIFRLGIQNYLARLFKLRGDRYWIAILFTATLWSAAHVQTLEPGWAKMAQVFPLGIALGWLARRYGLESCILAHGLFNLGMMALAPQLIQF